MQDTPTPTRPRPSRRASRRPRCTAELLASRITATERSDSLVPGDSLVEHGDVLSWSAITDRGIVDAIDDRP